MRVKPKAHYCFECQSLFSDAKHGQICNSSHKWTCLHCLEHANRHTARRDHPIRAIQKQNRAPSDAINGPFECATTSAIEGSEEESKLFEECAMEEWFSESLNDRNAEQISSFTQGTDSQRLMQRERRTERLPKRIADTFEERRTERSYQKHRYDVASCNAPESVYFAKEALTLKKKTTDAENEAKPRIVDTHAITKRKSSRVGFRNAVKRFFKAEESQSKHRERFTVKCVAHSPKAESVLKKSGAKTEFQKDEWPKGTENSTFPSAAECSYAIPKEIQNRTVEENRGKGETRVDSDTRQLRRRDTFDDLFASSQEMTPLSDKWEAARSNEIVSDSIAQYDRKRSGSSDESLTIALASSQSTCISPHRSIESSITRDISSVDAMYRSPFAEPTSHYFQEISDTFKYTKRTVQDTLDSPVSKVPAVINDNGQLASKILSLESELASLKLMIQRNELDKDSDCRRCSHKVAGLSGNSEETEPFLRPVLRSTAYEDLFQMGTSEKEESDEEERQSHSILPRILSTSADLLKNVNVERLYDSESDVFAARVSDGSSSTSSPRLEPQKDEEAVSHGIHALEENVNWSEIYQARQKRELHIANLKIESLWDQTDTASFSPLVQSPQSLAQFDIEYGRVETHSSEPIPGADVIAEVPLQQMTQALVVCAPVEESESTSDVQIDSNELIQEADNKSLEATDETWKKLIAQDKERKKKKKAKTQRKTAPNVRSRPLRRRQLPSTTVTSISHTH